MSKPAIFSFGRRQSERCPNKMLRPFADTTLTDIVLEKLARCRFPAFFAGFEEEFAAKCKAHGVPFVQRDERSAKIDGPVLEILSFLRGVESEHLLIVNACQPFIRLETMEAFLEDCIKNGNRPAFAVIRRMNNFLSLDRKALNFDIGQKTINTKTVQPVLEFAHALYFFNRGYFLENGAYWDWRKVRLAETGDPYEFMDIDTEADFRVAEAMWIQGVMPV